MEAVLDANVFMRGDANLDFDSLRTVPGVMEELESSSSRVSFDTSDIEVREPSPESLESVRQESGEINSPTSEVDEQLVALALDLDATVVSDDLAVQNLASRLGVKFQAYMGEEIDEERSWKRVCGNCGSRVDGDRCDSCGSTRVERKPDRYSSG